MKTQERPCGFLVLILAVFLAAFSLGAFAQETPPGRISYQGRLTDASGNPLSGSVTMTFRFYDDPTVGTLLWEETYDPAHPPQVPVPGGLYSVALGDARHLTAGSEALFPNVFALHATVYLAVKVGTDAEMAPRIQVISAPFALNSDTLDGKHATDFLDAAASGNFLNTSTTPQTKTGKLTLNSAVDFGVDGSGLAAGGYFHGPQSGYAYVGNGDYGIYARGNTVGGFFGDLNSSGYANVGYGDYGIQAYGTAAGGFFGDLNSSGSVYVGFGDDGINAYGNNSGGYFHGPLSGYAYLGTGNVGIIASGSAEGGHFQSSISSGYANVGVGDDGIDAHGNTAGGFFASLSSGVSGYAGYGIYSFYGTGAKAFVQNHPLQKDRVIVYTCPEGDEVATYTRGTARLVNGEARVKLGETFQWVTNHDLGLTAHLTPKGDCNGLYAETVSTTEMVVKELNGGRSNASFDYLVYGLRIGFEESSIVQEKTQEAYIPSFKDHRERYAKYPDLRAFNSLERFKGMESSVRGMAKTPLDVSRANALKDAIHEYDPATDPPVDTLFGNDHGQKPPEASPVPMALAVSTSQPDRLGSQPPSRKSAAPGSGEAASGGLVERKPSLPSFPSSQAVEAGDVIVMDLSRRGYVRLCAVLADPLVVGIAAGPGEGCKARPSGEEGSAPSRVPLATSGVLSCKVDASWGPIREGDLLVASPTPGHAMRADNPTQGTVLGKALEPMTSGTGLIKVLVMLR
jgi:hypothetical protein